MPRLDIDRVLKKKGWTRYKFGKALGVPTSNLGRIFKDDHNPSLHRLFEYARVLECKVRDLIRES